MGRPIIKCKEHWSKGTSKFSISFIYHWDLGPDFQDRFNVGDNVIVSLKIGKNRKLRKGVVRTDRRGFCGDPNCCGIGPLGVDFT